MDQKYIFDTVHYLAWCQAYGLQKNNQRVLELFKSRCDFEGVFDATHETIQKMLKGL